MKKTDLRLAYAVYARSEIQKYWTARVEDQSGYLGVLLRRRKARANGATLGLDTRFGRSTQLFGCPGIKIGDGFQCARLCTLTAAFQGSISIGSRVYLNHNVTLDAAYGGDITIGDDVGIGMNSLIRASNHAYHDPATRIMDQGYVPNAVVIGDDVWLGGGVIVLPGTTLSSGCVVAAGSVVGGSFPAYSVIAGNPARTIGTRRSE